MPQMGFNNPSQEQVVAGQQRGRPLYMAPNPETDEQGCFDQVSNSFHGSHSGRSIRGHSTSQECLRKIIVMLSRSNQTSTGFRYPNGGGGGRDEFLQKWPENYGSQRGESVQKLFVFLQSKEEEENERIRGQRVCSNSRPDDGLTLRLGLPMNSEGQKVQEVSGTCESNLFWNNVRMEEPRRDFGKCWWEREGGSGNGSSIGRHWHLGNNSSVESENLSVFQRSSEGECDPKNDISFHGAARDVSEIGNSEENVVDDHSKLKFIECDRKDLGLMSDKTEILCTEDTQSRDIRQSDEPQEQEEEEGEEGGEEEEEECAHMPTCSRNDRDGHMEYDKPRKGYSIQCREGHGGKKEGYGSLDLLVDAISLASETLLDVDEKNENTNSKKKRSKKHINGSCKRKPMPAVAKGRGTEDKPSVSVSSVQQQESSEENSEAICKKNKNETNLLNWYADYEDCGPLVRSKRGRNQALPSRFRDSVLEPWKRVSRPRLKFSTQGHPG